MGRQSSYTATRPLQTNVETLEPGSLDREEVAGQHLGGVLADERQVVWLRRGAGRMLWLRRILATCMCEIRKPSLTISP